MKKILLFLTLNLCVVGSAWAMDGDDPAAGVGRAARDVSSHYKTALRGGAAGIAPIGSPYAAARKMGGKPAAARRARVAPMPLPRISVAVSTREKVVASTAPAAPVHAEVSVEHIMDPAPSYEDVMKKLREAASAVDTISAPAVPAVLESVKDAISTRATTEAMELAPAVSAAAGVVADEVSATRPMFVASAAAESVASEGWQERMSLVRDDAQDRSKLLLGCERIYELAEVESVVFSRDGTKLVSGYHDGSIRFWDPRTAVCKRILDKYNIFDYRDRTAPSLACSPDGAMLASGFERRKIKLWKLRNGKCIKTLSWHSRYPGYVCSLAFSSDSTLLASASNDDIVNLWDLRNIYYRKDSCIRTFTGHTAQATAVTFIPGNPMLVSGSTDRTIKYWDLRTSECTRTLYGHNGTVYSVLCGHDNMLVSGSYDRSIRFWDLRTAGCIRTILGHDGAVNSLAFSSDGKLASASTDTTVMIWDPRTFACMHTLLGHKERVNSVAFSPNGAVLASGSRDQTARVWDREVFV